MDTHTQDHRGYGFVIGLMTGTFIGAGLAMWLAPRSTSEARERMTSSARHLGLRASDQLQQVSTRVGDAVEEMARTGQEVYDEVAGAVARGANKIERYATASALE
jgi:gas vesicle protein